MEPRSIQAQELLEKYGSQFAKRLLGDMLEDVKEEGEKHEIQQAIEELETLIQTDERGLYLYTKKDVEPSITRLTPALIKDCMEIWLFDDAIVTYNKLVRRFHGYRKVNKATFKLTNEELGHYKNLINNPRKLIES